MKEKGPGPKYVLPPVVGYPNHSPSLRRYPAYSMVGRPKAKDANGPGLYYLESGLTNKGRSTGRCATLVGRPRRSIWETDRDASPGPSNSSKDAPVLSENNSPRYSFGGPYRSFKPAQGPGPNSYKVGDSFGSRAFKATLYGRTKDTRGFAYDFANTPGPAAYGSSTTVGTGPSVSIGRRTKYPTNKMITPGPGAYGYPPQDGSIPNSPRFTLGIRHHEEVIPLADVSD